MNTVADNFSIAVY